MTSICFSRERYVHEGSILRVEGMASATLENTPAKAYIARTVVALGLNPGVDDQGSLALPTATAPLD